MSIERKPFSPEWDDMSPEGKKAILDYRKVAGLKLGKFRPGGWETESKGLSILCNPLARLRIMGACVTCSAFHWEEGVGPTCKEAGNCSLCRADLRNPKWDCPMGKFDTITTDRPPDVEPFVAVTDSETGKARGLQLLHAYRGREVILLGTGPSVIHSMERVQRAVEAGVLVMAINHAAHYLLSAPDFWVMVDRWEQQSSSEMLDENEKPIPPAAPLPGAEHLWRPKDVGDPNIIKITTLPRKWNLVDGRKLCTLPNVWFTVWTNEGVIPFLPDTRFSSTMRRTVAFALQVCTYLGFDKVWMVGHDLHFKDGTHCYEDGNNRKKDGEVRHMEDVVHLIKNWRPVMQALGTTIVNSTPGSRLESVTRFVELPGNA